MKFLTHSLKFWCCCLWYCCLMFTVGIYSSPLWPALAEELMVSALVSSPITTPVSSPVSSPIEVSISLGNTANQLKFFPDRLQLIAGKKYKLLLSNSSPQKHYFTAQEFASSSWTQKVDAGNVEIKGAIRELELRPGSTAAWVLVPMKPGVYTVRCIIPGHTEAGMTGTITVGMM